MTFRRDDTIAAVATPAGIGALAIIRTSGADAWRIAHAVFRAGEGPEPRRARVGDVVTPAGDVIDRGVLVLWRGPASYTGDDMAELTVHGGPAVVAATLEALYAAGARPAEPGEFTWRAVHNGKLDLTAAAAVADLTLARTDVARRDALRRLRGELSRQVNRLRDRIVEVWSLVEADVEFGQPVGPDRVGTAIAEAADAAADLIRKARDRETLVYGAQVAIAGPPNVGKSTLFNLLVGDERSIVTPFPGTTRDRVEAETTLGGVWVRLADLAGVTGVATSAIDEEGMRRAREFVAEAPLVIWVDDVTIAPPSDPPPVRAERLIWALNKIDEVENPGWERVVRNNGLIRISARTGTGVEDLKAEVARRAGGADDALSLSARERRFLAEAAGHLEDAAGRVRAAGVDEVAAEELRLAAGALGNVIGGVNVEDVYDEVFKQFCLGK